VPTTNSDDAPRSSAASSPVHPFTNNGEGGVNADPDQLHHHTACCAQATQSTSSKHTATMEFASTLLPKLAQLLKDEYNLHKGARKGIEFLYSELEIMHAALRKVGEVPREQLDELQRIWARDVRELSYDMEDIVDTFQVRVKGPEPPSKRSAKRFLKKMMGIVTKAKTRHEIGQEIKDIKERVKEVAERRDR